MKLIDQDKLQANKLMEEITRNNNNETNPAVEFLSAHIHLDGTSSNDEPLLYKQTLAAVNASLCLLLATLKLLCKSQNHYFIYLFILFIYSSLNCIISKIQVFKISKIYKNIY
jgi:hypothetical protein